MSGRALMSPYDRSEHGCLGDANRTELGDWESAGFYSGGTTRLCLTHYLRVGNYLSRGQKRCQLGCNCFLMTL